MSIAAILGITPWPAVSALIVFVLAVVALFFARHTAHQAIRAATSAIARGLRLASHSVANGEKRLAARNRDVLLSAGREAKERIVEREFERISDGVRKDLTNYPTLHRALSESIKHIEENHQHAVDVPPEAPGWVRAVDAVAKLDSKNGSSDILGDIHKSMIKAHKEAMDAYREASGERHALLHKMMPEWRAIKDALDRVQASVDNILKRSTVVDRHMQEYEDIVRGQDRAVSTLSSSSVVQFFVSGLVLLIAIGGAAINFSLIARPMSEMVGGTSSIGTFRTSDVAALVIIMVEVSMGLFLMESLRVTRLFPVIAALPDRMRIRMVWITFTMLTLLASVEAGLAYMREVLLQDELATGAFLRGAATQGGLQNEYLWITTVAQMGMGFILPFALTFVAIPFETFVHSSRTVLGLCGIGVLRALAMLLRVLSNGFRHFGTLLERIYDLPLFVPLWLEARAKAAAESDRSREVVPASEAQV
jgi:hypothetical protein